YEGVDALGEPENLAHRHGAVVDAVVIVARPGDRVQRYVEAHQVGRTDGQIAQQHAVGQHVQRERSADAVVGDGHPAGADILLGRGGDIGGIGRHSVKYIDVIDRGEADVLD